jgi:ABC-type phosphate transport system substrate-binding protein
VLACLSTLALVLAANGGAAPPPFGICDSGAKISGRGSTFGERAQRALARGFRDDFCGPTTPDPQPNIFQQPGLSFPNYNFDGNTHVAYNYWLATSNPDIPLSGSNAAVSAAACRTDAFATSSLPYTQAELDQMNGPPLACPELQGRLEPPYQPKPEPWSAPGDGIRNVMSFPLHAGAVALGINLNTTVCPGATNSQLSSIQLTPRMVSGLLGGDIREWDDLELRDANGDGVADVNTFLSNCNAKPGDPGGVDVQRKVRRSESGTTKILKYYLARTDNDRVGASCDPFTTWTSWNVDTRLWPRAGDEAPPLNSIFAPQAVAGDADCTSLEASTSPTSVAQLDLCAANEGSICYGDVAEVASYPQLRRATVRNAINTAYQSPVVGLRANCRFETLTAPPGGATGWVGLTPGASWAWNQAPNYGDITNAGSGYPICGLTFALVYTGGGTCAAFSRLTDPQCRLLYAYFSYMLSDLGQDRLNLNQYASLPAGARALIRSGFQSNF